MTETQDIKIDKPSVRQAIICFVGIILLISFGLFKYAVSLHSIMFFALLWSGGHAYYLGHRFSDIRSMMNSWIARALPAIYIFILIGMVIASFMQSGTIASVIY